MGLIRVARWNSRILLLSLTTAVVLGAVALAQEPPPKLPDGTSPTKEPMKDEPMTKTSGVPKVGSPAPGFAVKDHEGKEVALEKFAGKRNVLLAFFPMAFTGG